MIEKVSLKNTIVVVEETCKITIVMTTSKSRAADGFALRTPL